MDGTEDKKLESVRRLWDAYATIFQRRGVDVQRAAGVGVERLRLSLSIPGARSDFDELCAKGCAGPVLALLVFCMRLSPKTGEFWSEIVGEPAKRQKAIRAFQRAADTLDNIFEGLVKADSEVPENTFDMAGIASPAKVAASLRAYCKLLDFTEELARAANVRSAEEAARFLLTSYVKKSTRRYCDRSVSGIVGEILGPPDHNEVAQRMWRHRNSDRLEKGLGWAAEILFTLGLAMTEKT